MEATEKRVSPGVVLVMMLLSMTAGAMCMNKVAPVLSQIITSLNIQNEALGGMLISIFVFTGIVLALPIGMIIAKVGVFKTGLFALFCSVLGSLLGAFSGGYGLLLSSRLIEGIGLMFLATIGPAAVGAAFGDHNRGSAMGLLMCFMAFGQIIMFNLAPRAALIGSWKSVWWITAAFSGVALVLWLATMQNIDSQIAAPSAGSGPKQPVLGAVMKNKSVWFIGFSFMFFLIPQQGIIGFLPRYLSEVHGVAETTAGSLVSVASIVGIPVGILAGWVADKAGSRKIPLAVLGLACGITYAFMPHFPPAIYIVMIVIYGIATMGVAGLCMSSSAEVVDSPDQGNMAVSIVNLCQWVGIFISSILFGALLDAFSWNAAFYIMAPIAVLSGLFAVINRRLR
jgi:MFS family permease